MDKNRRNFYRILRVQPDASFDVIKTSYRTLLQKLRMHPDLGGDEWNASLINLAYNVLKDPKKRAEYDEELLKQYNIEELAGGHFKYDASATKKQKNHQQDDRNQRNYYRVLHVQSDSPIAIIEASYKILEKETKSSKLRKLQDEAFAVLGNKQKKNIYDYLLQTHGHIEACVRLKEGRTQQTKAAKKNQKTISTVNQINRAYQSDNKSGAPIKKSPLNAKMAKQYKPVITQYCFFCKTPHNQSPCPEQAPLCLECNSPLFPPSDNFTSQSRRDLGRLTTDAVLHVYTDWPGASVQKQIFDISPTGICIHTRQELEKGTVLKLDASDFKAVGEVTYSQKQDDVFNTGVCFLTVQFEKQKGQFFSSRI